MNVAAGNLARDLLDVLGEPSIVPGAILESIDWQRQGIIRPYVIFMTGRCGSTWLTSLLRDTGLAGNPEEFLNADVCRYSRASKNGLVRYFEDLIAAESSNERFGLEVDNARLAQVESFIDWRSVFPPRMTTTFYLYRRDLLAQAWSWVSAKKSGIWHMRAGVQAAERDSGSVPTHAELRREMVRLRTGEEFLDGFYLRHSYRPYRIAYESLVAEQTLTIATILRLLEIGKEQVSEVALAGRGSLNRISYSDKQRVLMDFTRLHRSAIDALECDRFGTSSKKLAELLDHDASESGTHEV